MNSLGDHFCKSLEMECKRGVKFAEKILSMAGVSFIPKYLRFFFIPFKIVVTL